MKTFLRFIALAVLFISIVILILYGLIYFNFDFIKIIQRDDLNEVGDALGGMASPIIGIISSVLVFLSFKEQNIANALIIQNRDEDGIRNTVRDFSSKIDLKYEKLYNYDSHTNGEQALTYLLEQMNRYKSVKQLMATNPKTTLLQEQNELHDYIKNSLPMLRDLLIVVTYCGYYLTYLTAEIRKNKDKVIIEYLEMYLTEFEMFYNHKLNSYVSKILKLDVRRFTDIKEVDDQLNAIIHNCSKVRAGLMHLRKLFEVKFANANQHLSMRRVVELLKARRIVD